jgi:hypothetical protein
MKLTHLARIGVPIACCATLAFPSSAKRYKLGSANALGALVDAERLVRALKPVLITDAFYEDFGSMGVCGIGGKKAPFVPFDPEDPQPTPYWYLAHDHAGATTGPDQIQLSPGADVLYYLTKGTEPGSPDQLALDVPRAVKNVKPFKVTVYAYDAGTGKRSPAAGASVGGETTNAAGKATITPAGDGAITLRATRGDDVPSSRERVCVGDQCSPKGELILGSPKADKIKGTGRSDRIKAGGGNDRVEAGDGVGDAINCGPGKKDVAIVDRTDRARKCEKVIRA